jgi:carbon-monoxide dehydrogenase small subunit
MVMSTVALLSEVPDPDEATIRHALEGNICRCTGYHNIVKAVRSAAEKLAAGAQPVPYQGS